jgi:hypothetical protein
MKTAVVCTLLTAIAATPASALVFCAAKGRVLVRDACKKNEVAIDTAAAGAKGSPGARGPGFRVVDRDGQDVGTLLVLFGTAVVVREIDGQRFVFAVGTAGFTPSSGETDLFLIYDDPTCQGAPSIFARDPNVTPFALNLSVSVDGKTGFFAAAERRFIQTPYAVRDERAADATTARTNCTVSRQGTIVREPYTCQFPSPPNNICVWCCEQATSGPVAPAQAIDLTALGLNPPFRLVAE